MIILPTRAQVLTQLPRPRYDVNVKRDFVSARKRYCTARRGVKRQRAC